MMLVVVPAITAAIPVSAIGPGPGRVPIIPELPVLAFVILVSVVLVLPDSISTEVVVAVRVVASSISASMACHGCYSKAMVVRVSPMTNTCAQLVSGANSLQPTCLPTQLDGK